MILHERPQSRGDFLANLLLYTPMGLTLSLALDGKRPKVWFLVIAAGALLSMALELAQFYDDGRVSTPEPWATIT